MKFRMIKKIFRRNKIEFQGPMKVSEELHKRIQEAPLISMEELEALCDENS